MASSTSCYNFPPKSKIIHYITDSLLWNSLTLESYSRILEHLFYHVDFSFPEELDEWKRIFQNPADSPASYTRFLQCRTELFDVEDARWIKGFNCVEHLEVFGDRRGTPNSGSFRAFHNLSPCVKSLLVQWRDLPLQEVFELICSFPELENLNVWSYKGHADKPIDESISQDLVLPVFTGTLVLGKVTAGFVRKLLGFGEPHNFRKIVVGYCFAYQFEGVNNLVKKCSHTLESIIVDYDENQPARALDLSEATKLKDVEFGCFVDQVQSVTATLETAKCQDLKQISFYVHSQFHELCSKPDELRQTIGELILSRWKRLDDTLVSLLRDLPSLNVKVTWYDGADEAVESVHIKNLLGNLLPGAMKKSNFKLENVHRCNLFYNRLGPQWFD